jgi:hypothetical protein
LMAGKGYPKISNRIALQGDRLDRPLNGSTLMEAITATLDWDPASIAELPASLLEREGTESRPAPEFGTTDTFLSALQRIEEPLLSELNPVGHLLDRLRVEVGPMAEAPAPEFCNVSLKSRLLEMFSIKPIVGVGNGEWVIPDVRRGFHKAVEVLLQLGSH